VQVMAREASNVFLEIMYIIIECLKARKLGIFCG
jgi:hypothetical protein